MTAMIYQKILRKSAATGAYTSGKILSFMIIDVKKFIEVMQEISKISRFPFTFLFFLILMCYYFKVAFLIGMVVIIFHVVINYYIARW